MKLVKSFYHRRPIVSSAGKHPEKTDRNVGTRQEKTNHNIGNAYSSYPYWSRWPEEEEVPVTADVAASTADVVAEARGQNYAGTRMAVREVSVLHLVTMCSIMDIGQLQIRWELRGKARTVCGYKLQTGHKQWATEQDPCDTFPTGPYSGSLGKTCHSRTVGLNQRREPTTGPLIKASHPRSFSRTWSWPWCTNATCDFG
jgi:hypothetical protein